MNGTPVTAVTAIATVPPWDLLQVPFLSPQTFQIEFSPIFRGGINWSVYRSNSLGTLHSTY